MEAVDPAFRVWLIAKRNTLRDRLLFALETAMASGPTGSRAESRLASATLNLDPTHEDACRRLMMARASNGDLAGALRIYKAISDLLLKDYDLEPSPATKSLLADIKAGILPGRAIQTDDAGSLRSPKGAARLAIALAPVTMHGVDPDQIHLVTGFRQHLLASLVRFREWQVTDAPADDLSLGGVHSGAHRYQLQMDVHQKGSALHMLLMLKEIPDNLYAWSHSFELKLTGWFEAQRQVVRKIALALNVHLSADRLHRLSNYPDISLGIYDRWLRSQTLIRTFSLEHWQRAASQFLEILKSCPQFRSRLLRPRRHAQHRAYRLSGQAA